MSWIEKELKKRTTESRSSAPAQSQLASEAERMQELWARFHAANNALPSELQLPIDKTKDFGAAADEAVGFEWLRAPNGAALGFAAGAIRYVWPDRGDRRSRNFWILWNVQRQGYVLLQRVNSAIPPAVAEYRFSDRYAEYMVKCLVLGKRIRPRSVRQRRLWLF